MCVWFFPCQWPGLSFRRWPKVNHKVYDIIIYLNKNLIKHFVLSSWEEKRYDIDALSIDRILNKEHLYEKSCRKCAPKVLTPF